MSIFKFKLKGGTNFSFSGKNIGIANGKVMIDGKAIDLNDKDKYVVVESITVEGDAGDIEADVLLGSITVNGNAKKIHTMSGDVNCGNVVGGGVETMSGDIECGQVGGSINTMSGDVRVSK